MATSSTKISVEDSIQVALDAADTATGVTEEFNNIREQFEVQNIQAKEFISRSQLSLQAQSLRH